MALGVGSRSEVFNKPLSNIACSRRRCEPAFSPSPPHVKRHFTETYQPGQSNPPGLDFS